jgi:tetratricopeptide (TPR) repeat protein
MKKTFAFTFIAALTLSAAQICDAQANKDAKEANKLARDGAEASKNQEWDKAIDLLRKATAMDKKYADELSTVYQQRAYAAASEQRFPDAVADYSEALKLTPQESRIYEQRAAVEMKTNDYDKALADYSEAIKLKPNEVRYLLYRSYIYETKGDVKSAMADTEKVLKIDPKNQEALSRKQRLEARQSANEPLPPPPRKASPAAGRTP